MSHRYRLRKNPYVEAVQWHGYNLKDVIDLVGLHASAKKWTWREYENTVDKEGLRLFSKNGSSWIVPIGHFVVVEDDGNISSYGPTYFVNTYEAIIEKD